MPAWGKDARREARLMRTGTDAYPPPPLPSSGEATHGVTRRCVNEREAM